MPERTQEIYIAQLTVETSMRMAQVLEKWSYLISQLMHMKDALREQFKQYN